MTMERIELRNAAIESDDLMVTITPSGTSGKIEAAGAAVKRLIGKVVTGVTEAGRLTFSDGTEVQIELHAVSVSDTAPRDPRVNALWVDTHASPDRLRRWDGSDWLPVG